MSRKTARTAAMQMIFEKVSGGQGGEETLKMVYDELRETGVPGIHEVDEIDGMIAETAKGWTLDRMALVDLTILRLAVWEMLYDPQVPGNVSIAEAMELTERYSDPDDKAFVNGILGTILRAHEAQT